MTKIYNLLHNNAVWLTEQLDIPSLFTNNENLGSSYRTHTEFKADTTTPVAKKFNPLHQFCHIGVSIFDLVSMDGSYTYLFLHGQTFSTFLSGIGHNN